MTTIGNSPLDIYSAGNGLDKIIIHDGRPNCFFAGSMSSEVFKTIAQSYGNNGASTGVREINGTTYVMHQVPDLSAFQLIEGDIIVLK